MVIFMRGDGVSQPDLVDLCRSIITKYVTLITKLDADTLVGSTDYVSGYSLNTTPLSASIKPIGIDNSQIYNFLLDYQTKWNAICAHLDADSGVVDTNYTALWGLGTIIGGSPGIGHHIDSNGINQGDLLFYLNKIIVNMAGVNAKLAADAGVTDADYSAACNITDVIDEKHV